MNKNKFDSIKILQITLIYLCFAFILIKLFPSTKEFQTTFIFGLINMSGISIILGNILLIFALLNVIDYTFKDLGIYNYLFEKITIKKIKKLLGELLKEGFELVISWGFLFFSLFLPLIFFIQFLIESYLGKIFLHIIQETAAVPIVFWGVGALLIIFPVILIIVVGLLFSIKATKLISDIIFKKSNSDFIPYPKKQKKKVD